MTNALVDSLSHVEGGARAYYVQSAIGYLSIIETPLVNKTLVKFLSTLTHTPVQPLPYVPVEERMQVALEVLAEWSGVEGMEERDPRSPMSFSVLSDEEAAKRIAVTKNYAKGQEDSFSPLNADGRPVRK
jgi:hypothetical protein